MVDAVALASVQSELRGLSLDDAAIAEVQARVQHLLTHPAELIARRQDLERRTSRTISEKERLEYRLLSATREVKPITPEGQLIREEYQPRDDGCRVPYIGLMVRYVPRSGEGRSGKPWFPAWVADIRTHGVLLLTVLYDPQEIRDVAAPKRSADNLRGCWEYMPEDPHFEIAQLKARVFDLESKLDALVKNGRGK
jgi:hypothetical protein